MDTDRAGTALLLEGVPVEGFPVWGGGHTQTVHELSTKSLGEHSHECRAGFDVVGGAWRSDVGQERQHVEYGGVARSVLEVAVVLEPEPDQPLPPFRRYGLLQRRRRRRGGRAKDRTQNRPVSSFVRGRGGVETRCACQRSRTPSGILTACLVRRVSAAPTLSSRLSTAGLGGSGGRGGRR